MRSYFFINTCARMVSSKSACCHIDWVSMVMSVPFCLRVRLGQYEVEVSGSRDEVLKTFEDLPKLVATISEAFGAVGFEPGTEVSVGAKPSLEVSATYPSIQSSGNCSDAV